ncbi:MAG: pyridoxal phosphate-dependent aminotransferase [Xanthobacteraceae bacterium]|nr:pyridoxal phosphate-dependent aminotransferase [Xanthobacteraceae bacterium]
MTKSAAALKPTTFQISDRVRRIPGALSIYINQIVYDLRRRGQDVTALSLGEAFFDIPLFDFRKLDFQKGYHYSDSLGIPELREKIAEYYGKHYGAKVSAEDEVLITAGSKIAIFMAMKTVLNPGDEVLIHEPAWLSYREQTSLIGAEAKFIPYSALIAEFSDHFTARTRILVINNPNNPAGRVYSLSELREIYSMCRNRGIYLLVDEAYSDFVRPGEFASAINVAPSKEGLIVVNSLSKNLGMSGWRVGYAIAHPAFIQMLLKVNQHLITCAPTLLLYYMARYFDKILSITLPQVRSIVEKRLRIEKMIEDIGLDKLSGASTFYFFISIGSYQGSSVDFALNMLLKHNIAVVPGSAYGESTNRFIRVSVGTESEERIAQALLLIRDEISTGVVNRKDLDRRLAEMGIQFFGDQNRIGE